MLNERNDQGIQRHRRGVSQCGLNALPKPTSIPRVACWRARLLQAHVASVNETRQRTWDEQRREDDQDKSREETAMQCGKCNAAMEEGFVVDYAAGGNRKVAEWVQGEPKGSFWHGVDLSSASQIPIVTYRCAACGYLEFYARGKELGLSP